MTRSKPTIFGSRLKRLRKAAGLTQEELAEVAGISVRGLSDLERGVIGAPRLETLALLAKALHLSMDDLSDLQGEAPNRQGPLASPFPVIQSARACLPYQLMPLVGRDREVAEVVELLQRPDVRLLTLIGLGGVGKTSLALHVAGKIGDLFDDGAAFVSLAEIDDPAHVTTAIAQALGLQESGSQPLPEALGVYCDDRQLLLVLDNFEHVMAAAQSVAELYQACPRLTLCVTSREALHLRGEQLFLVPPLPAPDLARPPDPEMLARCPSVQLFLHRARAAKPDFALTMANAAAIAGICTRVDGLPLAIELASAQVDAFPPALLLARLARRLDVLTDGPRDAPERQRTVRATLAWSYELLTPVERTLFLRLCIFQGGCTLDAAEALSAAADDHETDVAGVLRALVMKSMLQPVGGDEDEGAPRYTLLQLVREYGLEVVTVTGATASLRRQHAAYFLSVAEMAACTLRGPRQAATVARLKAEGDNLRAALQWALECGEVTMACRLTAALWRFWDARGHLSEGRDWLGQVLALTEASTYDVPAALHARVLTGAGTLAYDQGDCAAAIVLFDRALDVGRAAGDLTGMAAALNGQAHIARVEGDLPRAEALYMEALALRRQVGDRWDIVASLNNMGLVARDRGHYARAAAAFEEGLALKRALGDLAGVALALNNLGLVARDQGLAERARDLLEEGLRLFRALDNMRGGAFALTNLAVVLHDLRENARAEELAAEALALRRTAGDQLSAAYTRRVLADIARDHGEHARATDLYAESLPMLRQLGNKLFVAPCLEGLALIHGLQGRMEHMVRLYAAASALRDALGTPLSPADQLLHERALNGMHAGTNLRLPPAGGALAAAWAAGWALSLDEAIVDALHEGARASKEFLSSYAQ